jgi:hypothetical protein
MSDMHIGTPMHLASFPRSVSESGNPAATDALAAGFPGDRAIAARGEVVGPGLTSSPRGERGRWGLA